MIQSSRPAAGSANDGGAFRPGMIGLIRHAAFRTMASRAFVRAVAAVRGPACAPVLMHRFDVDGTDPRRHDPRRLRALLADLRAAGVALLGLEEAIAYCGGTTEPPSKLAVSFTVDDGYEDFAEVAWPVFREFDCPVSLFVVPGAINGSDWFWWDKLDFIMRHGAKPAIDLEVGGRRVQDSWTNEASRRYAYERVTAQLKFVTNDALHAFIGDYGNVSQVTLPAGAPPEYRVLGWERLRALEAEGVRVGPHSMTHPVLSRCSAEQVAREISDSVDWVHHELKHPLPVFCYPNGRPEDHGTRDWDLVKQSGAPFALTASGGLLTPGMERIYGKQWPWRLPRIGYDDQAGRLIREFVR